MTDPRFLNPDAPMGLRHYPDDLESAGVVGRHGEWAWLIAGLHRPIRRRLPPMARWRLRRGRPAGRRARRRLRYPRRDLGRGRADGRLRRRRRGADVRNAAPDRLTPGSPGSQPGFTRRSAAVVGAHLRVQGVEQCGGASVMASVLNAARGHPKDRRGGRRPGWVTLGGPAKRRPNRGRHLIKRIQLDVLASTPPSSTSTTSSASTTTAATPPATTCCDSSAAGSGRRSGPAAV